MLTRRSRLALLMHGQLSGGQGKMGWGLLRYAGCEIVAVIDRNHAGKDSADVTGIPRSVPVVADVADAIGLGADTLVIGIAPPGGILPDDYRDEIVAGLSLGMSLVNGLHGRYAETEPFASARRESAWIWDVRQEPDGLPNGSGAARELSCARVLTVGTDMAIGKMTVSLALDSVLKARGFDSRFVATGQIGLCVAASRRNTTDEPIGGVALDAVRVDFASGAVEAAVLQAAPNSQNPTAKTYLQIEGQGSVLHPASTAWLPLIRGSVPTHLILCHRAGQTSVRRAPWAEIPPLSQVAALYASVARAAGALPGARVVGVALNTADLPEPDARAALREASDETGLPAADVVRFGPESLADALIAS